MGIKGIIFDLDGVLVCTDEMHYKAWKRLAKELGILGYSEEDSQRQRGISRMESLEILLEKADTIYNEDEKACLAEKKNAYFHELLKSLDRTCVLEGVEDALDYLKKKGIALAVGSASKNALLILRNTGLDVYFEQVSCGLDTSKSKPDPEVFLIAAQKLNLKPEECLVVEDSAAGIEAARRGNMKSLGVGAIYKVLDADFCAERISKIEDWDVFLK